MAIVFERFSIIGITLVYFHICILHISIGDNNWINDDCIVHYTTELIPLAEKLVTLETNPLLLTKPPVLFLGVNHLCNYVDGRLLLVCNSRLLLFVPYRDRAFILFVSFCTIKPSYSDRTRIFFFSNVVIICLSGKRF
jgi:hypothetical protein